MVDHIVYFLRHDTQTLLACTAVSRSWQSAASYFLFAAIHICPDYRDELQRFLNFLQLKTSKFFAARIRYVAFRPYAKIRTDATPFITAETLSSIILCLPNLWWIHLRSISFADGKSSECEQIVPPSYRFKIRFLQIEYVGYHPHHKPHHLLGILGIFSEIRQLHLEYPRLHAVDASSPTAQQLTAASIAASIPTELRVSELSCFDCPEGTTFWFNTLRQTASAQTLTNLIVGTSVCGSTNALALLLEASGPNLRELDLNF